jgi:hypothetical protein
MPFVHVAGIRRCVTLRRRTRKALIFAVRLRPEAGTATDRFGEIYDQILSVRAVGVAKLRVFYYGT